MAYRPKDLERWLKKYMREHPHEKITITDLANFSGISRNTWYRNPKIIQTIESINETPVVFDFKGGGELPTAEQLVRNCKSEKELIAAVQSLLDEIVKLNMVNKKENVEKLNTSVLTLKNQLKERDERIRLLTSQIDGQIISALPNLTPQSIVESTNVASFKDQFADLFGDVVDE